MSDTEQPSRFLADEMEIEGNEPVSEERKRLFKEAIANIGTATSGNYGHAGRPKLVGGSAPGDGSPFNISDNERESFEKTEISRMLSSRSIKQIPEEARKYGYTIVDENHEIGQYMNDEYNEINSAHRDGIKLEKSYQKMSDTIEGAIDEAPAIGEVILYRGLGERSGMSMASKEIGDICTDAGFQSFTLSPIETASFLKPWGEDRVKKAEYTVIRAITNGKTKALVTGSNEEEVIVQKGTRWVIVHKETFEKKKLFKSTYHVITVVPE